MQDGNGLESQRLPLLLLGLVLASYVFYDLSHSPLFGFGAGISAAVAGFFFGINFLLYRVPWWWLTISLALLGLLIPRPFEVANHHWVLMYVSLACFLSLGATKTEQESTLAANGRWLLILIMLFAVIQRVFSPLYMGGDFFGMSLATGSFGKFFWETGLSPAALEAFQTNRSLLQQVSGSAPDYNVATVLEGPFPAFSTVALFMVYSVLVFELWLSASFLLWPKRIGSHLSLMFFGVGLIFIRPEAEFIALTLVLGLMVCPKELKKMRVAYGVLIAFCAVLNFVIGDGKAVYLG